MATAINLPGSTTDIENQGVDTTVSTQGTGATIAPSGPQYPSPPIATTASPGKQYSNEFDFSEFELYILDPSRNPMNEFEALKLNPVTKGFSIFGRPKPVLKRVNVGVYKSKEVLPNGEVKLCFSKQSVTVPASVQSSKVKIFGLVNPTVTQTTGGRRKSRKSRKAMKKRSTRRRRH